jgi:hypothetical protein
VWKWSHYAIVEAVEPFKLHPTSMSYIYKVFEHLKQLWMGIWQHIHTITTTDVYPGLGELAEIIDDVNVKTIPLSYHWGCSTFQTASHIHVIHILGVWTPKQLWMGIWQHTHTVTTTDVSSDLGKYSEVIDDVSVEMIPLCYCWGCRTFQTASHIHVIQILGAWTP